MAQKYPSSRTVDARLHRLVGQLQAIEKMTKERRPCAEVLYQISAVRSGLEQVAAIVFEIELQRCAAKKRLSTEDVEKLTHAFTKIR
jgi:DNA-binding FrmR family transcriptional regulator